MKIEDVKAKHEDKLMQLPNVTGVGIGEEAGKSVIKVYVTHKVSKSDLQSQEMVPKTLEGWKIDVEELGVITPQNQSQENK